MDTGVIRYSPKLLGASSSRWWVVLDADPELGKYYRHLFHIHRNKCNKLQKPAWESHITIVRDEEPPNKQAWEKYDGLEVEFEVVPEFATNGDYFWFPVRCQFALDLRAELGLGEPRYPLHFSIGHGCY